MKAMWMSAVLGMGLLLAGCVHVTEPDEADLGMELPDRWVSEAGAGFRAEGWLADFGDPRLESLVSEALAENPGLEAGLARLEQARALARIEGADRLPSLNLTGTARRQMSNNLADPVIRNRSDRFDLGAAVSWELDLWGRVRAQVEAELPELEGVVPAELPSGLLARRPDIRAAAGRVMAADARLMEIRRSLLPAINLTGNYGRAGAALDDLLGNSFKVWSLVGGLTTEIRPTWASR
jgi:outer membrane protein TolC